MGSYAALWRARLQMMRPGNASMAAVGVLVGAALVAPIQASIIVPAMIAAAFVTAFGNVLNDILDRNLDAAAHPERPLPAGRITLTDAKGFALLLLGFGLVEAYLAAGTHLLAFATANAALLGLYEWKLKRAGLVGNLVVALLVASTFLFGAAATGTAPDAWGLVVALATMAFLANVARELLKDLQDVAADTSSRTTFPMQAGAPTTLAVATFCLLVAIGLSAWTWWTVGGLWGAVLLLADATFLAAIGIAWRDVGRGQQLVKNAMLLALAAFALSAV